MDITRDAAMAVRVIGKPERAAGNLAHFNLLRNPFPERTQVDDVFIKQDEVKNRFYERLGSFRSGPSTTFFVLGNPGGGKSAFLRWAHTLVEELRKRKILDDVYPLRVSDPSDDFMDFYGVLMDQIGTLFMDRLVSRLQERPETIEKLGSLTNTSLLAVLGKVAEGVDRQGLQLRMLLEPIVARETERKSVILQKWLRGEKLAKLNVQERKALSTECVNRSETTRIRI